ncbi:MULTISPECIES: hypothetical protein [Treponema]|uniref:hypothetical protein n=1 Tax=Treponema TaxID=157 RepID=UPI0021063463|nr:hypothetical protein [Treponema putidum]
MSLKDNSRFEEQDDGSWYDTQKDLYYSKERFDEMDEMSDIYNVDTPEDLEDAHSDNCG